LQRILDDVIDHFATAKVLEQNRFGSLRVRFFPGGQDDGFQILV